MLDPKESRFWQATVLSGLMDAQKLTACWNAIPPGKRENKEHIDRRLARQAIQTGALTLWQAQQLMAGRTSGFKVDRYVLLDLIGQGGMGRVYLAQDSRLNRRVALKILSPERVNNPRAIARFQREARVGAQLQHENLVRIYDFGESNGRYFLVMEYIEGDTIGTMITKEGDEQDTRPGRIPPAIAVGLIRQVAMGLEHAHRKGLIHRDVNPYNILVTRDGTAKLADLGLALDLAEEDRVTREGATVGTFDYVAPEQARQSHSAGHPQRHLLARLLVISHVLGTGAISDAQPAGEALRTPGHGTTIAGKACSSTTRGACRSGPTNDGKVTRGPL